MNLFNKIAVRGDEHLNPGPAPPAGHCHDVPVKGPHNLLYLLAQGRRIDVRGCGNARLRDAAHKIVGRPAIWRAWGPDLRIPHLWEVFLEPVLGIFTLCPARTLATMIALSLSSGFATAGMSVFIIVYTFAYSWLG